MSIANKLKRLKRHLVHSKEEQELNNVSQQVKSEESAVPYIEEWKSFQASPFYFDGQYCIVREVEYPLTFQHGRYRLGELINVVQAWNEQQLEHPLSSKGHQPFELFFFDTETTGLKGGAGNVIFLLGHARILDEKVVIKQHFLPAPGHEVALYQSFLSEVNIQTLVTYNGKAFDWPQVKTRHMFIRNQVPKLPAFGHFDLYHASRRLWKEELDAVKLAVVEKEMLEINRERDIPGYLAPIVYFHFLQNPHPDVVRGIFEHNEKDVLSLITLYIHLSKLILNASEYPKESFEIAKWLKATGNEKAAFKLFSNISINGSKHEWKAKYELSFLLKQQGDLKKAVLLWEEIIRGPNDLLKLDAHIELAKYYEHIKKNLPFALKQTNDALHLLTNDRLQDSKKKEKYVKELSKRKQRLLQKLKNQSQQ
ncbi:ribonuclease H-like domain-containing protein [Aeribacillus alveayuensis]|jgi:uncharacterized protein|uniref:Uncharacterized protein YprB with RNaseH-like and TPR domain n=1 Tax=Aeribacillus alveayuensis TaxID=279215 RepID=A0ABT9VKV7_9BACI|nr:ribonuclease H-like domain-containing protein [Bacillus alveayuensis]MDQ0161590.1 uncharacterized protein YprB with RNaseH-like and TPR domain [Bacillus alveayuensis]